MGELRMPSLGADMDVGTIIEWRVAPGDQVHRGDIVAVVDTAKAAIEIEAFEDGVVEEIVVGPGVQVPVGTTLARLGPEEGTASTTVVVPPTVRRLARQLGVDLSSVVATGEHGHMTHDDVRRAAGKPEPGPHTELPESATDHAAVGAVRPPTAATVEAAGVAPAVSGPSGPSAEPRRRVTPHARRLAAEAGVDLAGIPGTGADGAVLASDVEDALAAGPPSPAPVPTGPPGPAASTAPGERKAAMRAAIASLMSRSAAEIPHYYVTQTIDMAGALAWLRSHNAGLPTQKRVLRAAVLLRAAVIAALEVPDLNGHWVDGELRTADHVDLGVAVATRGGGLVTPAIPNAEGLGIDQLMAELADLVRRARGGALRQAEMAGGTITVSSLGETGPDALYGVIFPPQVALVGLGGIVDRPWAVDGMLTVRPTVTVTLAADHRASDGRTASAFLAAFAHALHHPEEL